MMKRIVIVICCFLVQWVHSQQTEVFSNFWMNQYQFNPAVVGKRDVHVAQLNYRNQWVGFEDAPVNVNGGFYGSVKNQSKHGYGITLGNRSVGLFSITGAYLNYAYHIKLGDSLKLALGIKPGFVQYRTRLYDAVVADVGDEVLTGSVYGANALDLNGGIHLYGKKFYIMGSVQQVLGKVVSFTAYNPNLEFHFNGAAAYRFEFKKSKFSLEPTVLATYVNGIPLQWSGMMLGDIKQKFQFGLGYRSDDAAFAMLGMTFKERFTINYTYDVSVGGLRNYNSGSHELGLAIVVTKKKVSQDKLDDDLNKSILDEMNEEFENKKK